ncbi:MAG: TIGR02147 family protein [Bdellovibrionales bacterium]|nr:TIGR02147 family protein [Bdellovibrionales bacterium]
MTPDIYQYQSAHRFLLDRVNREQKSGDSIRNLAKRMGLSHTLLVMFLQGKRPLRVKHAGAIAQGLGLDAQARLYLQALIQFEGARDPQEKQLCQLWLSELHPDGAILHTRVVDEFEVISNWIHMAILSIASLRDFDPAPEAIAARLGAKVTAHEVRAAISRLKSLGLIRVEAGGRFVPTQAQVTTQNDVISQGARAYHKQVMDLAKDALDRQPLEAREFQSFAIDVARDRIPLAKELIRKFRTQFVKAMKADVTEEVYQMNIQLFQLTESPAARKSAEDEGVDAIKTKKMETPNAYPS